MSSTLKYTLVYLLAGASWILITDYLVQDIESSSREFTLQNIKGLVYVVITSLLVYFLLYSNAAKIRAEKKEILRREQIVYRVVENTSQEYCLLSETGKIQFKRGPITSENKALDINEYLSHTLENPSDIEHLISLFYKSLETDKEFEREIETKNKFIRYTLLPVKDQREVILVLTDLTGEKADEKKRGMTREFLNLITQSKDIGYWHWSLAENKTYSSQSLAKIIGAESSESVPSNAAWIQRIHEDDLKEVNRSYAKHLNGDTDAHEGQYRILTIDGHYKWLIEYARVIQRSDNGEPLEIVGVIIDFDLQKKNEASLAEKQDLLQKMASSNSHHVRGPLARILGLVELYKLMRSQQQDELSITEVNDILEKIRISSEELDIAIEAAAQILESKSS